MKKELKSGTLSADKSSDCLPTVGGVNVIAILQWSFVCGRSAAILYLQENDGGYKINRLVSLT